jgi:hypothetical protein
MGQAIDDTGVDRISDGREDDRQSAADMLQRCHSMFDPHIAPNIPAQFLQALVERCKSILTFRVVRSPVHEDTNPPQTIRLLRARRERPRRREA